MYLQKAIPFAVVGSNTVVEAGGKKIRGRMYPWGIVEGRCTFITSYLHNRMEQNRHFINNMYISSCKQI